MLNRDGISKVTYNDQAQILANVELQASVGCVVDDALGSTQADGSKIVPAGTQAILNYSTMVAGAVGGGTANCVILHDVNVTAGDANGTALIFGFINKNRVKDATAKAALSAGTKVGDIHVLAL